MVHKIILTCIFRSISNIAPADNGIDEMCYNVEEIVEEDLIEEELIEYELMELVQPSSSSSLSSRSTSASSNYSQSPEMKRKKKKLDTSDVLEFLISRPPIIPQTPNLVQDDLSKFLLGLGATMKQFKPVRLANIKLELATIVGKAEIENALETEKENGA